MVLPALYLLGGCQLVFSLSDSSPQDAADAPPDGFGFPAGVTKLAGAPSAHGLLLNQNYVYYTTSDFASLANQVGRVSLSDGVVEPLSANEPAVQNVFTPDDTSIYWTTWQPGELRAIDKVTVLGAMTLATFDGPAFAFAIPDANGAPLAPSHSTGHFYELPTPPSGPLQPTWSATTDLGKYSGITGAVIRDGELFWTNQTEDPTTGGVFSMNIAEAKAGNPTIRTWVVDDERAWGLVVTTEDIVYSRAGKIGVIGTSGVVRIPRGGGAPVELVRGRTNIRGIAVDGGDVYFAEHNGGGGIWKVPLDASALPLEVVENQRLPLHVAVDDKAIFWTSLDPIEGGVFRVAK